MAKPTKEEWLSLDGAKIAIEIIGDEYRFCITKEIGGQCYAFHEVIDGDFNQPNLETFAHVFKNTYESLGRDN